MWTGYQFVGSLFFMDGTLVDRISPEVALYDISGLLKQHETKEYLKRPKAATALFVHHTGADNGHDDWVAWYRTSLYHVLTKKWAGIAYHYGVNRRPIEDEKGYAVLYRLAPEDTVRYHTGWRANRIGSGLVLQGHLGLTPMSEFQKLVAGAGIRWWLKDHGRTIVDLGWHANAWRWGGKPKPACPGKHAVVWLKDYVASYSA